MRLSLNITNYSWPGGTEALGSELARVVRAADAGEIDTVWVADHLLQADPTAVPDSEMLEAYTALGSSPLPRSGCGSARWSARSRSGRRAC